MDARSHDGGCAGSVGNLLSRVLESRVKSRSSIAFVRSGSRLSTLSSRLSCTSSSTNGRRAAGLVEEPGPLPASLVREGAAMIGALAADLQRIAGLPRRGAA